MKRFIGLIFAGLLLVGCGKSDKEWKEKYEGCKVLAAAIQNEKTEIFKTPNCEDIPRLCSRDPKSAECQAELKHYFRKK